MLGNWLPICMQCESVNNIGFSHRYLEKLFPVLDNTVDIKFTVLELADERRVAFVVERLRFLRYKFCQFLIQLCNANILDY